MLYNYEAEVLKIIDGDTVELRVDLGFKIYSVIRARLAEINTAELRSADESERILAKESKAFLESILNGKKVIFKSVGLDKYGRSIAHIYLDNSMLKSVSSIMLEANQARPYQK